jgi:hypothetical protein
LIFNDKNRSDLETAIKEVKQEIRSHHQQLLAKRKELIRRLGKAFQAVISNPKDVCEEIKNCLQEERADGIISTREIERYCPDKWKTKPKNDNLSFYKQVRQISIQEGTKADLRYGPFRKYTELASTYRPPELGLAEIYILSRFAGGKFQSAYDIFDELKQEEDRGWGKSPAYNSVHKKVKRLLQLKLIQKQPEERVYTITRHGLITILLYLK